MYSARGAIHPLMMHLLVLCGSLAIVGALPGYIEWKRDAVGQVDIYAPTTLAVSWLDFEGNLSGYLLHLNNASATPRQIFAKKVCNPYALAQEAIFTGGCSLTGGNSTIIRASGERASLPLPSFWMIKYDIFTGALFTYSPPFMTGYNASTYERVRGIKAPGINDYYITNGVVFYAKNESMWAYAGNQVKRVASAPHNRLYTFFIPEPTTASPPDETIGYRETPIVAGVHNGWIYGGVGAVLGVISLCFSMASLYWTRKCLRK